MAASAANSTAKFCRRLFQDAAPRVAAQQTMDQIIRADQERFSAKWNFDITKGPSNSWQIINEPKATFYIKAPRRLKAKRRLNLSVAERLRMDLQTPRKGILTESPLIGNFTFNFTRPEPLSQPPEQVDTAPCPCFDYALPISSIAQCTVPCGSNGVQPTPLMDSGPIFKLPSPEVKTVKKRKSKPKMTGAFASCHLDIMLFVKVIV
ncbi:unnamed protein product [Mesocestoides corti]|uniref:CDI domain-containing protein n=1 Tax=Mesocestoides corti TaxID=53468 RepID=A0A0R3UIT7_MESCO|nr:unnamed protein product [Mesocestoides corti]